MINKAILIGRLTKKAELKSTTNGKSVCNFTLAVQRDKDNTDFIPCVMWGKTAEILAQYTDRGSLIAVEGRIQVRLYDSNGVTKYATEIICDGLTLCDSKPKETEETPTPQKVQWTPSITEEDLPF